MSTIMTTTETAAAAAATTTTNTAHLKMKKNDKVLIDDFREQILSLYRCPFLDTETGQCERFETDMCSFNHQTTLNKRGSELVHKEALHEHDNDDNEQVFDIDLFQSNKPKILSTSTDPLWEVPSYVCADYLMSSGCDREVIDVYDDLVSVDNIYPICVNGFHLPVEQMLDLEYFESTYSDAIITVLERAGTESLDATRECAICLERVAAKRNDRSNNNGKAKFAIMQNCSHCFCAECIVAWQREDYSVNIIFDNMLHCSKRALSCPLCRVTSTKVLLYNRFVDNTDAKLKQDLFCRLFNDKCALVVDATTDDDNEEDNNTNNC